jgi:hypothetical protein
LTKLGIAGLGNATDTSKLTDEELTTILDGFAKVYAESKDNELKREETTKQLYSLMAQAKDTAGKKEGLAAARSNIEAGAGDVEE